MIFTKEQKKAAYDKLTDEVRNFVLSRETSDMIEEYLETIGLTGEQSDSADLEILYAMYNLQTLSDAMINIAKISNKRKEDLSDLKNKLQLNIFDKIQTNQDTISKNDIVTEKSEIDVEKTPKKDRVSKEQIGNLPQVKQKFISDGVWEERTSEVAKKYSLSESQTDSLINNVLFVLIGLEKPDNFLKTIIAELGISRLLAEQIMTDLETRVFEYAFRIIEDKQNKSNNNQPLENNNKNISTTTPEIKPDNLPMVEEGEVAHDTNPKEEIPPKRGFGEKEGFVESSNENKDLNNKTENEPVQRPIPVPRYTGTPEEESSAPTPTPTKKYTVDPYREPLE